MMLWMTIATSTSLIWALLANIGDTNQLSPTFITKTFNKVNHLSFTINSIHRSSSFTHLPHGLCQSRHILSSTMEKGNNNPGTNEKPREDRIEYNVIYQKVLRARSKESSQTFLLELITYLQSMYELPDGLTMPYEREIPDEDDNISYDKRAILVIDSSLADDVSDARIEVEVIGIFPDSDGDMQPVLSGPTMAMVALKKIKSNNGNINSVTQGLFANCEKSIIQSLDRGLQDLEEGRVSIPSSLISDNTSSSVEDEFNDMDDDGINAAIKRMGYRNAINAASSDDIVSSKDRIHNNEIKEQQNPISIERDELGNIIIDSKVVLDQKEKKRKTLSTEVKIEDSSKSSKQTTANVQKSSMKRSQRREDQLVANEISDENMSNQPVNYANNQDEDYAIKMARKQAEALMTTAKLGSSTSLSDVTINISGGESEFAIMAAKQTAARKTNTTSVSKQFRSKGQEKMKSDIVAPSQPQMKQNAQDLSEDAIFKKLQSIANKSKQQSWSRTIFKKGSQISKENGRDIKLPTETIATKDEMSCGIDEQVPNAKNIDVDFSDNDRTSQQISDDQIREDIEQVARNNKEVQDLLKSATDMLPNDADEDLSPEELLERVLKFGDEKEKEEKTGFGFVEGAMGKAKDLLQSEQASDIDQKALGYKEVDHDEEMKRKAEEDELKRIFAAGQNTAQEKLSKSTQNPKDMTKAPITEADIDALIAADETVPLNARNLDEEFAEFEVRVARSIGEESDGSMKNKMFDVFSGPEVYNPNVDPLTAVNWPGAKEGTRTDVHLAKELEEALKQAKFAAAVLLNMREEEGDTGIRYFVGEKEITTERVQLLRACVNEAVKAGIIEDPEIRLTERARLQMLMDELMSQPEERLEEIALNYKDLLLSDNLIDLVRERLYAMAQRDLTARRDGTEHLVKDPHAKERAIMMNLVQIAQGLIKEAQALGAELEVSMLEIIRSICEVAMNPDHKTEEETAVALTDAVRDMRPLLDDTFVGYLKYAIAEEEAKLERQGIVDDPEHNRWLFVLKIVQEGVYAELSRGVKRYIDHIGYVLRMKTKLERKELLAKLIEVMPTMDVRPFVKVVRNIVSSLGTSVRGDFADGVILGEMTNKLLQLQRDVEDLLPPDRVNAMSKGADNWAAKQRERLMERQKLTRQRLRAAREMGSIDTDKIVSNGEYDRFD